MAVYGKAYIDELDIDEFDVMESDIDELDIIASGLLMLDSAEQEVMAISLDEAALRDEALPAGHDEEAQSAIIEEDVALLSIVEVVCAPDRSGTAATAVIRAAAAKVSWVFIGEAPNFIGEKERVGRQATHTFSL